jgi:Na+/proline symporter
VSLTDFVQVCIMCVALVLVPIVTISEVGGVREIHASINTINPALLDIFSGVSLISIIAPQDDTKILATHDEMLTHHA